MTLSQFLRDYLYIPLGGNRHGRTLRYVNLMITMLLGGLWHGAAWTFVAWGALHGVYLCINHAWNNYGPAVAPRFARMANLAAFILTFLSVVVGWVFFAPTACRRPSTCCRR
jgi:D-alanyl-lipoteichoic acid acyltransferase DltB (MBOAT superfamily)